MLFWFCVFSLFVVFFVLKFVFCFAFCFLLFLFWDFVISWFWLPINGSSENPPKGKMQKKTDILAKTVRIGVLTNSMFFCVSQKFQFLLNTLQKEWFQINNNKFHVLDLGQVKVKTGPSMLRNKFGPVFNTWNCFSEFFVKKEKFYFALRTRFSKTKKKKTKKWTSFNT